MKKSIKLAALLLISCLMLSLSGCGKVVGRYRVVETLMTQEFSIGYRENDYVRYYVDAALQTLAADGTISTLAYKWFGEDNTSFSKNINALEQVGQAAPRTLLVGVDADAFPMSYIEGDSYSGFDVELAREVCSRLGWTAKFISIKAENAYVELSSGNIDVAWGGLALEREDVKYEVTAPYLTNDIVIVTLAQGGAKTLAGLKGDKKSRYFFCASLSCVNSLNRQSHSSIRITNGLPVDIKTSCITLTIFDLSRKIISLHSIEKSSVMYSHNILSISSTLCVTLKKSCILILSTSYLLICLSYDSS